MNEKGLPIQMVIKIKTISDDLQLNIPDLITRPIGKMMYLAVKKTLSDVANGDGVILDFKDIRVMDPSFIDEFIVKLLLDSREGERAFFLKLSNLSDSAEINIDSVFNSYYSFQNVKLAVITDNLMSNNSYYVGNLSDVERDIIGYMNVNKVATASDIVSFLGERIDTVSGLLERLYEMRVLRKEVDNESERYLAV